MVKKLSLGVLASGRGSNLQAIIKAMDAGKLDARVAVVASNHREARALGLAGEAGLPGEFLDPRPYPSREDYDKALGELLAGYGVELVVLAGFMRLLTPALLDRFPGRVVNIHPSLLPAFPGKDAQRQAWEYGVRYSGCTVHFVDAGMDTGPIIDQAVVPVLAGDTPEELAARILKEEHILYPNVLQRLARGLIRLEGRRVELYEDKEEVLHNG